MKKDKFKINSNQQKKLRSLLDSTINAFEKESKISKNVIDNIIEKIPDIHNPSFKKVLLRLLSEFNVATEDLEKDKVFDFISIRNELFHKGKIDYANSEQVILEKERLFILVERLILRILDFPERPFRSIPDMPIDIGRFSRDQFIK